MTKSQAPIFKQYQIFKLKNSKLLEIGNWKSLDFARAFGSEGAQARRDGELVEPLEI